MRIDLHRLQGSVDQVLDGLFPPAPNATIVSQSDGLKNEYDEEVSPTPTSIPIWLLFSDPTTQKLRPSAAGAGIDGESHFTARGTTRHPRAGDVVVSDGIRWRVITAGMVRPAGRYVDGTMERMRT